MGKCCKGENLKNRSTWSHFFQNCKTSYLYGSFSRASKTVSINLFVVQAGQINRRLFWLLNILASTEMQLMGNETLSSLSRLDHFIHKNKDMEKNNRGQLFSLFPGPTRGYNAADTQVSRWQVGSQVSRWQVGSQVSRWQVPRGQVGSQVSRYLGKQMVGRYVDVRQVPW